MQYVSQLRKHVRLFAYFMASATSTHISKKLASSFDAQNKKGAHFVLENYIHCMYLCKQYVKYVQCSLIVYTGLYMFSSISESKDRYSRTQMLQIALAFLFKCFLGCPKVPGRFLPNTTEYTLSNTILRIARNFLETRENLKIVTHPFYHINLG